MTNHINISLDTKSTTNALIKINGGSEFTGRKLINLRTIIDDIDIIHMKIWGDVNNSYNENIQITEKDSKWIDFSDSVELELSDKSGFKTIYLKLKDDVHNESSVFSERITYISNEPTSPPKKNNGKYIKLKINDCSKNIITINDNIINISTDNKSIIKISTKYIK